MPDDFTLPYVKGSSTSKNAAEGAQANAPTQWKKVFDILSACPNGSTDQEQYKGEWNSQNYSARRGELVDAGLVYDTGRTKEVPGHRAGIVWAVVPGAIFNRDHVSAVVAAKKAKRFQVDPSLTGQAKAIAEIEKAIPKSNRSSEIKDLLVRLKSELEVEPPFELSPYDV